MGRRMKRGFALGLSAALLVLAGCGGGGEEPSASASGAETSAALTPVKLQLQWFAQAQFAGYYAAVDQGYYEEEGLAVEILPSGGDIVPQDALAAGEVDYAVAWVPKVLGSIEQGAAITNVAQIKKITELCGSALPRKLTTELDARAGDAEAVAEFGVAYATLQCMDLLANGAPGIHFYTLNRSPATRAILSALKAFQPWRAPTAA